MRLRKKSKYAHCGGQTTLAATFVDENPNDNKTFPYGLLRTVRHYLEFIGLLRFVRGLKRETKTAPRLDLILVALIVYTLWEKNSMDACADWLSDESVRRTIGFRRTDNINQKTIDRAVEKLGIHREEILEHLWKGVTERFEIDDYDVAVDGSAVVLYGPKSRMGALGHPRDGRDGDLQVEFTVAVLLQLGIPVYIRPFRGNVSDEEQYREAIPEIMSLVQGKRMNELDDYKKRAFELGSLAVLAKVGVTIIADNGAASKENMDRAEKTGAEMITRTKMNASDDKRIKEHIGDFEPIAGMDVLCLKHTFESSGKTNYLFYSHELFDASLKRAVASINRGLKLYKEMKENGIRKSKIVKVRKVIGIDVDYEITMSDIDLSEYDEDGIRRKAAEQIGIRAGFFKLTSTVEIPPKEALLRYRRRGIVEQTISSLKRISGIKPLRVWSDGSIEGSMILALLSEAVLAMARYCAGKSYRHVDARSGKKKESYLPSTGMMVRELGHLTLTRFRNRKGHTDANLSNWTDLTTVIFSDIHSHESPEWGSRKVPASG
jgi:transposase